MKCHQSILKHPQRIFLLFALTFMFSDLTLPIAIAGGSQQSADKSTRSSSAESSFNALYEELLDFRKDGRVQLSSSTWDYNNCEAFRNIVSGGKKYIPYIIREIRSGDFFLNQAMYEITRIDIKKYFGISTPPFMGEQEISKLWLRWWEENKSK